MAMHECFKKYLLLAGNILWGSSAVFLSLFQPSLQLTVHLLYPYVGQVRSACENARKALKKKEVLALINRAGGLYGRILTMVVSTDRTQ